MEIDKFTENLIKQTNSFWRVFCFLVISIGSLSGCDGFKVSAESFTSKQIDEHLQMGCHSLKAEEWSKLAEEDFLGNNYPRAKKIVQCLEKLGGIKNEMDFFILFVLQFEQSKYDAAENTVEKAIVAAKKNKNNLLLAICLSALSEIKLAQGKTELYDVYIEKATKIILNFDKKEFEKAINILRYESTIYNLYYQVLNQYIASGDIASAKSFFSQVTRQFATLKSNRNRWLIFEEYYSFLLNREELTLIEQERILGDLYEKAIKTEYFSSSSLLILNSFIKVKLKSGNKNHANQLVKEYVNISQANKPEGQFVIAQSFIFFHSLLVDYEMRAAAESFYYDYLEGLINVPSIKFHAQVLFMASYFDIEDYENFEKAELNAREYIEYGTKEALAGYYYILSSLSKRVKRLPDVGTFSGNCVNQIKSMERETQSANELAYKCVYLVYTTLLEINDIRSAEIFFPKVLYYANKLKDKSRKSDLLNLSKKYSLKIN